MTIGVFAVIGVGVVILMIGACCICSQLGTHNSGSSNINTGATASNPSAAPSSGTPTSQAATDTYSKYINADKATIKADSQQVDWQDFLRNPDNYQGKLIVLKGDIVVGTADVFNSQIYNYDVNVNPNLFPGNVGNSGDNYAAQFVELQGSKGLLNGDLIDMYGVPTGYTSLTNYPIIKAVYVVYYTSK